MRHNRRGPDQYRCSNMSPRGVRRRSVKLEILAGDNLDRDVLHCLKTARECSLDIKHQSIGKSILIFGVIHTHIIDDSTAKAFDSRLELQEPMGLGELMRFER